MTAPPLTTLLAEAAPRLTMRVLDEMYANPFWYERFGERGRLHAGKDGLHHLGYLTEALQAGDPRVFVEYARWLRDLLTARGMCTRHLVENFERLAAAIADQGWADGDRAVAVLAAGAAALVHAGGDAGAIDHQRAALAAAAADSLHRAHPDWRDRWGEAGHARCVDELDTHLSYLADALAADRGEAFTAYARDLAGQVARRALPADHQLAALDALAAALAAVDGLSDRPAACLADARRLLARPVEAP